MKVLVIPGLQALQNARYSLKLTVLRCGNSAITPLPKEAYSQPSEKKALSSGIIWKSACILAEMTIWKSQHTLVAKPTSV
jgi:hypothetical protein